MPPSLGRWQFQGNYWKLLQSYSNAKHWQWAPFSKFFHFLLVLFASCLGMSSIVALVVITRDQSCSIFSQASRVPASIMGWEPDNRHQCPHLQPHVTSLNLSPSGWNSKLMFSTFIFLGGISPVDQLNLSVLWGFVLGSHRPMEI